MYSSTRTNKMESLFSDVGIAWRLKAAFNSHTRPGSSENLWNASINNDKRLHDRDNAVHLREQLHEQDEIVISNH